MGWLTDKIESVDDPGATVVTTRTIDTEFTPSATKYTFVSYTITLSCDAGETSTVELRTDAASPPTVVHCSAFLGSVGSGDTVTTRHQLTAIISPTHKV